MGLIIGIGFSQDKARSSLDVNFYKAALYYDEAKYDKAIGEYNKILNQEYESGNLYYNLGNCYYKKGLLPQAIAYYEKAKRFIPRDADLIENIKYVQSKITKSYQEPRSNFMKYIISKTFGKMNINEIMIFIFIVNIIVCVLLVLRIIFMSLRRYFLYPLLIFCVIGVITVYSSAQRVAKLGKEAIVVSAEAVVKFEPQDSATTHYIIYGGEKVILISRDKNWHKVRRLDGKVGWIKVQDLKII